MSSAEIKKDVDRASGPSAANRTAYTVAEKPNGGARLDVCEALSSRFESLTLIRTFAHSGFYLARDRNSSPQNAQVMLRVFSGQSEGGQLALFQLEACSAAKLSHRGIIRAGPSQELNGVHFCVMENPSGAETLTKLLDREGWLDPRIAVGIAHQIADALEYAHRCGVLHLQIHPECILIEPDGTVVLADFGIDGRPDLSWARTARSAFCPVRYASPEQTGERPLDFRSDLYSLGVVLYKMMTDRLPVDSEDADSVRQKHISHSAVSPHLFCSDIPLSLSAVVARLLDKDPARRFQDIADLRIALESSANAHSVSASLSQEPPLEPVHQELDAQQGPVDQEQDAPSVNRIAWEPPTIALLNSVLADTAPTEMPPEQIQQTPHLPKLADVQGEEKQSFHTLTARTLPLQEAVRGLRVPPVLVVMLALAAIGALMVLAGVDRSRASKGTASVPVSGETGRASGDAATPGSEAGKTEPASSDSDVRTLADRTAPGGSDASADLAAKNALSSTPAFGRGRTGVRKSSGSSIRRQRKRTWRPVRYRRGHQYLRNR